jgi:hypothetical protein
MRALFLCLLAAALAAAVHKSVEETECSDSSHATEGEAPLLTCQDLCLTATGTECAPGKTESWEEEGADACSIKFPSLSSTKDGDPQGRLC